MLHGAFHWATLRNKLIVTLEIKQIIHPNSYRNVSSMGELFPCIVSALRRGNANIPASLTICSTSSDFVMR